MPFFYEQSASRRWTTLQAEHDLLEKAIEQGQCFGCVEYLSARVSDSERRIVLYYIQGIGRGDGWEFALIIEQQILCIDVARAWGVSDTKSPSLRIQSIDIPEKLNGKRAAICGLLLEALQVYDSACPFEFYTTQLRLDFQKTEWKIVPQKYS